LFVLEVQHEATAGVSVPPEISVFSFEGIAEAKVAIKEEGLQGIEWVILRDHSGGKACG
jgi:hypothetical protein